MFLGVLGLRTADTFVGKGISVHSSRTMEGWMIMAMALLLHLSMVLCAQDDSRVEEELWAPRGVRSERYSPDQKWKVTQNRKGRKWQISVQRTTPENPERDGPSEYSFVRSDRVVSLVVTDNGGIGWIEYSASCRKMRLFVAEFAKEPSVVLVKEWERFETTGITRTKTGKWLPFGFPVSKRSFSIPGSREVVFLLADFADSGDKDLGLVDCSVLKAVSVETGKSRILWSRPRISLPLNFSGTGANSGFVFAYRWNWEAGDGGAREVWAWNLRRAPLEPVISGPIMAEGPLELSFSESNGVLSVLDKTGTIAKRFGTQGLTGENPTLVEMEPDAEKADEE